MVHFVHLDDILAALALSKVEDAQRFLMGFAKHKGAEAAEEADLRKTLWCEVGGQEDPSLAARRVLEAAAPQRSLETLERVETREHDRLIADQARGAIHTGWE
jgi:hypothetical protein